MRESKRNKHKQTSGTNLKVSPLKVYKKQIKRMKNRIKGNVLVADAEGNLSPDKELIAKYQTRLDGAELHLKNYDKEQEQKKADAMKVAHLKK